MIQIREEFNVEKKKLFTPHPPTRVEFSTLFIFSTLNPSLR